MGLNIILSVLLELYNYRIYKVPESAGSLAATG
jgi:hypothetical protein